MTDDKQARSSFRRRWLAVSLATIMMIASFVVFVYSLAAASGNENAYAGGLLGIGLGLVPAVFAVAAWASQNPNTIKSTVFATLLWFAAFLLFGYFSLPVALVAGYGAGGVVAFRLHPDNSRRTRAIAVALCVVYTGALLTFSTTLGLFAGAALPFLAIVLADLYEERGKEPSGEISP
ncbi:MAG TPA: hypothetical protein VEB69_10570 [Acidimicrobiia bacterium]|nr:hypothetical protein [Acidimicrobiia bacterium]